MATSASSQQRILVIRNRFIGDTVLAIPFLRNLRQNFPSAIIDVLVEPVSGDVLASCPYVDELIRWSRPRTQRRSLGSSLQNLRDTARWLAGRRYDRCYILKRAAAGGLLAWAAGIPHRIGFACQGQQLFLSRAARLEPFRHEVEHFLNVLRCDGLHVDDGHNENWVDPEAAARIEQLTAALPRSSGPWVFIAPCAGGQQRRWPAERFADVIQQVHAKHGGTFFLCGGPGDRPTHEAIQSACGNPGPALHDLSAACFLAETAALIARCDLCIGVDTGLMHIAASFGRPCAVIAGAADPNQWHPWQTSYEVLRSARPQRSARQRITAAFGLEPRDLRWPVGRGNPLDVTVEQVVDASLRLLTPPP
jgi:heptosyltransferase-2